jgi:hypothetical protein
MKTIGPAILGVAICCTALPSASMELPADPDTAAFVSSNVIATFYHELGHALIHVLELPVLGREEDAADSLSTLLTHQIWNEESATAIMSDAATAYLMYNDEAEASGVESTYWGEHSLDLQRYYTLLCHFYGADPDNRGFVITEFELPEERAEACPDEFAQVESSWMQFLDDAQYRQGAASLVMQGEASSAVASLLATEVADFNKMYSLPTEVLVELAPCDEANAFYNLENQTITICTEYVQDLERLYTQSHSQ